MTFLRLSGRRIRRLGDLSCWVPDALLDLPHGEKGVGGGRHKAGGHRSQDRSCVAPTRAAKFTIMLNVSGPCDGLGLSI